MLQLIFGLLIGLCGGGIKRMKIKLTHKFEDIVSIENLLYAWEEFIKGKRKRKDVQQFQFNLIDNIISLHQDLINLTYKHGEYQAFNICDPKPRNIHKASVRDRLVHHAIYRKLYPFFDRTFISDSYSCRLNKGTHRALNRFRDFSCKIGRNRTKIVWILKCDIRKFFANINHSILLNILEEYIPDQNILWLLKEIIKSFETKPDTGLPLGNLTSQLLVNIYMNRFDQFVKHKLKAKHYIRYADDFVLLSDDKKWLNKHISVIEGFLNKELKLEMHSDKVFIKTLAFGIDFLGWIHFPDHRILRTSTKKRMLKNIRRETLSSYLGLLRHSNTYKLQKLVFKNCLLN